MAQIIGELVRKPGSDRITGSIEGRDVVLLLAKRRRDAAGEPVEVWQMCIEDDERPPPRSTARPEDMTP